MDVKRVSPGTDRMQTYGIIRGSTFCAEGPDFRALATAECGIGLVRGAET